MLWAGRREKGMHPRICHFDSFRELVDYLQEAKDDAGDSLDVELSGAVAFVLEHTTDVPSILDAITAACTGPDEAEMTLSTAHRAKGLEWDDVMLLDDFGVLQPSVEGEKFTQEEVNLLYVAVTRARQNIADECGGPVCVPTNSERKGVIEQETQDQYSMQPRGNSYFCECCGQDIRDEHRNIETGEYLWEEVCEFIELSNGLCRNCYRLNDD
jgi:hypothetical protein